MLHSTVTKKGQTTLPGEVRKALHVKIGDRLAYELAGDHAVIRVHPGTRSLMGSLAGGKGKGMAFKAIRRAAARNRVAEMAKQRRDQ